MYSFAFSRLAGPVALVLLAGAHEVPIEAQSSSSSSQTSTTEQHPHPAATPAQEHESHDMQMAREGSGTSWLSDESPMYAIHAQSRGWTTATGRSRKRSPTARSSGGSRSTA